MLKILLLKILLFMMYAEMQHAISNSGKRHENQQYKKIQRRQDAGKKPDERSIAVQEQESEQTCPCICRCGCICNADLRGIRESTFAKPSDLKRCNSVQNNLKITK